MATIMVLPINDLTLVCRSCLAASGDMKNMTIWGYSEDFYKLTNIQVNPSDNISELLCTSCEEWVLNYRSFVQRCHQSDQLLKDTMQKSNDEKIKEDNSITMEMNEKELTFKITAPDMKSKIYLPCNHCHDTFLRKTDLISHLTKKHNVDISINMTFHCSIPDCAYNSVSGKKFFTGRKYLNQHVFKVHCTKRTCHSCNLKLNNEQEFNRHLKTCNNIYTCEVCDKHYRTNENFLVHLLRKHPDLHKQYKIERKAEKRKMKTDEETKKIENDYQKTPEVTCDSPKRSFATQTLDLKKQIKNDVTLPSWLAEKYDETKKDEISTQTVFDDILSLKSQNSEDDLFFSETVSLSDIQTQTIPLEFGLSRSNKETITSETQSPDLSIKETQTCFCLYESQNRCFEGIPSNSNSICTLTSTETQTHQFHRPDELMSFTSTETQTCFDDLIKF